MRFVLHMLESCDNQAGEARKSPGQRRVGSAHDKTRSELPDHLQGDEMDVVAGVLSVQRASRTLSEG